MPKLPVVTHHSRSRILPWTAAFNVTYLVNLARREDRLRVTRSALSKSGVPPSAYQVFNATDARELDVRLWTSRSGSVVRLPRVHIRNVSFIYPFNEWWDRPLVQKKDPGSVGAFLTYVRLFEQVLQSEHRTILILEDDLKLEASFHSRLSGALALLPDDSSWDALYLGYNEALFYTSKTFFAPAACEAGAQSRPLISATPWAHDETCVPLCKANGTVLDMVAFAVNRRIVPSLLAFLREQMEGKRMLPIDVALAIYMQQRPANVYVTRPLPIVVQRARFADSDSTRWGWANPKQPLSAFAHPA